MMAIRFRTTLKRSVGGFLLLLRALHLPPVTANAFAEDAQRCLDAGMNAHLAKPLEIEKAISVIANLCEKKQN